MANEHAVPEHQGEKVHGDKLENALEHAKSPAHESSAPPHIKNHAAMPDGGDEDGDGGGDAPVQGTDGRTIP